jgi:hypothetical protein
VNTPTATNTPTNTPTRTPTRTPDTGDICDRADVDGDGDVDVRDVVAVAHQLGKKNPDLRYDVTRDGKVNARDLLAVIACRFLEKHGRERGG